MIPQPSPHRPLVIAHRGGSGLAPENTLTAFRNGLAHGADGIELDVHLSRDGVAVVIHDATLERTTNGTGAVADCQADELAAFDAGWGFGAADGFPWRNRGCRIPRLSDVLASVDAQVLIELKTASENLVRAVIDDVRAAGADDRVLVGSFHPPALAAVAALAPHLRRGADRDAILALAHGGRVEREAGARFHSYQVPEAFGGQRIVTGEFVRRARAEGVEVYIWTVDAADDIRRLLDWGVTGIITDRPDIAVPAVAGWWRARTGRQA